MISTKKKSCILCYSKKVKIFINFGKTPLANNLIKKSQIKYEKKFPLILGKCLKCNHVQLCKFPRPELMFNKYLYLSSASSTLTNHLKNIPKIINNFFKIKKNDLVIDIGSNDGTLLSGYKKFKVRKIGVEPAQNLKKYYKNRNLNLINTYFNFKTANKIKKSFGLAKIITATNVFPHLQDLIEFARAVSILLDQKGILLIEAHYLQNLINDKAFDTIYHEHCSYWSVTTVKKFCDLYNLELIKVDKLPIHHGQIRCWIAKKNSLKVHKSVQQLIKKEKKEKLHSNNKIIIFKRKILNFRMRISKLFLKIEKKKMTLAGYGAPAKATTLTSFLKISKKNIPYIFDKNPLKQNKLLPGSHIPILKNNKIFKKKPDYLFNFAWNFINEIVSQNSKYIKLGGIIINPIPKIKFYKK